MCCAPQQANHLDSSDEEDSFERIGELHFAQPAYSGSSFLSALWSLLPMREYDEVGRRVLHSALYSYYFSN